MRNRVALASIVETLAFWRFASIFFVELIVALLKILHVLACSIVGGNVDSAFLDSRSEIGPLGRFETQTEPDRTGHTTHLQDLKMGAFVPKRWERSCQNDGRYVSKLRDFIGSGRSFFVNTGRPCHESLSLAFCLATKRWIYLPPSFL